MSNTITSPYMSLVLPIPGLELGPQYAIELDTALTVIDQHNHTSGQGLPIPTAALDINADLSFNEFNLTNIRGSIFNNYGSPLSLVTDKNIVYVSSGELFFNNAAGQQTQITLNGAVDTSNSGNIQGMAGTNASVVYTNINGTFSFYSNTGIPASMDFGPIYIGNTTSTTNKVGLLQNGGQTSSYNFIMPASLPSTTATWLLSTDSSGQISTKTWLNGATITFASVGSPLIVTPNSLSDAQIIPQGITAASINNGTITSTQIASSTILGSNIVPQTLTQGLRATMSVGSSVGAGGFAISSTCGSYTTTSTAQTAITNLSISITTTGRPVRVELQDDQSNNSGGSGLSVSQSSSNSFTAQVSVFRNSGQITQINMGLQGLNSSNAGFEIPGSSISHTDLVPAGNYTYTIKVQVSQSSVTFGCTRLVLVAYEI
jgi:hypothetical protein